MSRFLEISKSGYRKPSTAVKVDVLYLRTRYNILLKQRIQITIDRWRRQWRLIGQKTNRVVL